MTSEDDVYDIIIISNGFRIRLLFVITTEQLLFAKIETVSYSHISSTPFWSSRDSLGHAVCLTRICFHLDMSSARNKSVAETSRQNKSWGQLLTVFLLKGIVCKQTLGADRCPCRHMLLYMHIPIPYGLDDLVVSWLVNWLVHSVWKVISYWRYFALLWNGRGKNRNFEGGEKTCEQAPHSEKRCVCPEIRFEPETFRFML